MKRFVIILLTALIIVSMFSVTMTASAQTEIDYTAYEIYETYSKDYRQRFAGSEGEGKAANFIANKLLEYGYTSANGEANQSSNLIQTFNEQISLPNETTGEYEPFDLSSKNVVAYKRNGKEKSKLLVLGCSYGNAYGYNNINNEGAYESSSAVATLLDVASKLRTEELDFDVAFAFFGAEFFNHAGTRAFLSMNKQSILGYINLDSIGGGDDLYVYYDDVQTAHGELIDGLISENGYNVKGAPFDKGVYTLQNEYVDRPYFHKGLNSANYLFIKNDIPSVNLFGYNWTSFGGSEFSGRANILGTENDDFEYVLKQYGKDFIAERINLASTVVTKTVLQNTELAVSFEKYDNSYTNLYSDGVYYGISFALLVLVITLFIVGYVIASKKTQKVGSPDFATNSTFLNGNNADTGVQKKDEVFDFGNEPIISDNKDIDTQENSSDNSDDDIFGEF